MAELSAHELIEQARRARAQAERIRAAARVVRIGRTPLEAERDKAVEPRGLLWSGPDALLEQTLVVVELD